MTQKSDDGDHVNLLLCWQSGSTQAGEELYRQFGDAIRWYFRRNVWDVDAVGDLVQDTFLRLQKTNYRREGRIRGLIFGIANKVLLEYLRQRRRCSSEQSVDELLNHSAAEIGDDPEYVQVQKQDMRLLMKAMRRIPLRYQIVLELSEWEDLTQLEIAAILSRPEIPVPAPTIGRWKSEGLAALDAKVIELEASPELRKPTTMTIAAWRRSMLDASKHFDSAMRTQKGTPV